MHISETEPSRRNNGSIIYYFRWNELISDETIILYSNALLAATIFSQVHESALY